MIFFFWWYSKNTHHTAATDFHIYSTPKIMYVLAKEPNLEAAGLLCNAIMNCLEPSLLLLTSGVTTQQHGHRPLRQFYLPIVTAVGTLLQLYNRCILQPSCMSIGRNLNDRKSKRIQTILMYLAATVARGLHHCSIHRGAATSNIDVTVRHVE